MIPVDELKKQHAEICELMSVVAILLSHEEVRSGSVVQELFSTLADKVKEHIALEEGTVYRDLLVDEDHEVQRVARNFLSGSHGLKKFFGDYLRHSASRGLADQDIADFIEETEEIFQTLKKRIAVEENQFYPLVEKHEQ